MMGFTEQTGAVLDSVTFLVFGAVLLGPALEHLSWRIALYAVLSLTIVRMVPVAISLWGILMHDWRKSSARKWAGSSKGYWRVAGSRVLQVSLPNTY